MAEPVHARTPGSAGRIIVANPPSFREAKCSPPTLLPPEEDSPTAAPVARFKLSKSWGCSPEVSGTSGVGGRVLALAGPATSSILDLMTKQAGGVPAARVVRQGAVMVPEPRVSLRERVAEIVEPVRPTLRGIVHYTVGLWPIWVVAALAVSFLWVAGMRGSP
jgi:hypothetical protein